MAEQSIPGATPHASDSIDRAAYPFAPHTRQLRDGTMHYADEGRGAPVLFVHGTPTWSFEWRHAIRALAPTHRCIAPDLLGFGLSERPRGFAYTPEAHARALAELVEQLDPGPLTLVVHDFGGPIGLPLALDRPELVRRLVVVNTWMWRFVGDREMEGRARLAGSPLGRFLYRRANLSLRAIMPSAYGDRRKLTPAIHRQYLERFPDAWSREAVLWALARALLGSGDYYDSLWRRRGSLLDRPALVIWGMRDSAFRPNQLARWREALPHAEVVELAGAGHWPHEEEPERFGEALLSFLQQPAG
jgi:haloalkane dehalogenase